MRVLQNLLKAITCIALALCVFNLSSVPVSAQGTGTDIDIERTASYTSNPYPVYITGLSGEALKVLSFDLEVGGCNLVAKDKATHVVTASNEGNIVAKFTDKSGDIQFFNRSYKNGTTRLQAHALAGDIIKVLTGKDSIFNDKIAFCINTATDKNEIYIADFDGANPQQITRDGSLIRGLTWGPENRSLFYCSYMKGNPDIYFHDLQEGKRNRIAAYTGLNTSPEVSPDGTKVAMILSKNGNPELYVSNLDGSDLKRLTNTSKDESSPCWSPDGKTICFSSRLSGYSRLYTIPATGGTPKRINTSGVGSATEPDWSPDGKTIAFTTVVKGGFQICTVPVKGGVVEVLAAGTSPKWASNSRTLIFSRKLDKKSILLMLDVPTKKTKTISNVSGSASQPCWTR